MPSNFPGSLDTYTTKVDKLDANAAADVNALQDAVAAIETTLKTSPNPNPLDYVSKTRPDTITGVKDFSNGARGLTIISKSRPWADITHPDFAGGADPTGAVAMDAALAAAAAYSNRLEIPQGTYLYNGTGLANARLYLSGEGQEVTTINLGASSYLYNRGGQMVDFAMEGLTVSGGLGAVRQGSAVSNSTRGWRRIQDCQFIGYTQCAVADLGTDTPYWNLLRCWFQGANWTTTIGVAIAGTMDFLNIDDCAFEKNRVHLKLAKNGLASRIHAEFHQSGASAGFPRVSVWFVPPAVIGTGGMVLDACRFGGEGQETTDWVVVCADEDATGADFSTHMPVLGSSSSGSVQQVSIVDADLITNSGLGQATGPPLLYTTTGDLRGWQINGLRVGSVMPRHIVEGLAGIRPSASASNNTLGPLTTMNADVPPIDPTTVPGLFRLVDPAQVFEQSPQGPMGESGGGTGVGYINLAGTFGANLFNATTVGVTDSKGGTDALEITIGGSPAAENGVLDYAPAGVVDGQPIFIEFDLKQGSSSPLSRMMVALGDPATSMYFVRYFTPTAVWVRHRLKVNAHLLNGTTWRVDFGYPLSGSAPTGTKYQVGRVRIYHGREPILADLDLPVAVTSVTAPAAGGAGALPATPLGYLIVYINGSSRKIPYYANP